MVNRARRVNASVSSEELVSANGGHGAEWDWRGGRVALHRRI
jgi:hypothetical protein